MAAKKILPSVFATSAIVLLASSAAWAADNAIAPHHASQLVADLAQENPGLAKLVLQYIRFFFTTMLVWAIFIFGPIVPYLKNPKTVVPASALLFGAFYFGYLVVFGMLGQNDFLSDMDYNDF